MIIRVSEVPLSVLLGLLGLCLALSAFFSGTETALMSFNRYQLRTMANAGHRGAILAERLLERPDRLIGLILLGNNLVNNFAAMLVTVIVLRLWGDEWIAVGAGLLTLLMLIFCEVGPKTYGALHPRRLATTSSYVYTGLQWLLRPLVYAISWVTNGALRLIGVTVDRRTQQTTLSREELRTVVAEAGVMIPRSHQQMLLGIIDLERITVDDIMIPRQDIAGIDLEDDWERILDQLRQTPHTRLPVYRGGIEDMVGLLHMKRVAQELARGSLDRERLEEVARQREPYYVPESTPLTVQLANFQRDRRRMAFVVDEYGDVLGLVTLEDILEEIVGEIADEYDTAAPEVTELADGAYRVMSRMNIDDFANLIGIDIDSEEEGVDTVLGLMAKRLGRVPIAGADVTEDGWMLTAERGSGRRNRISTVLARPARPTVDDADD